MSAQHIAPQQPADTTKGAEIPKDWFTVDEVLAREREVLKVKQGNALCISGGGIRSATFALGALQGLAELDLLEKFDYLSTVSGGGYIGSWLTAWKQRWGGLTQPTQPWGPSTPFRVGEWIIDGDNNVQMVTGVTTPITNIQVSNNVVTITAKNDFAPGVKIVCSGLKTADFLNGKELVVSEAGASYFKANFQHTDLSTHDKGTAKANAGTGETGLTKPSWSSDPQARVTDGSLVWACRPKRKNSAHYDVPTLIIDDNGNVQELSSAETTDNIPPQWKKAAGEITADGKARWLNRGPAPAVVSQLRPSSIPFKTNPDPAITCANTTTIYRPSWASSPLTPRTLVATVARNMLLNWMVFFPLLLCGLMLPRIVLSLARLGETYGDWYVPGMSKIFTLCERYPILESLGLFFFALASTTSCATCRDWAKSTIPRVNF